MQLNTIRNPRAECYPLRSIPLFRSARSVFGSSARDVLVGDLRKAQQFPESWAREYAKACAGLGKAILPGDEATEPAYRQAMEVRWAASDALQDMRPRTMQERMAKAGVAARLMDENHGGAPVDAADAFALATLRHVAGQTSPVTR